MKKIVLISFLTFITLTSFSQYKKLHEDSLFFPLGNNNIPPKLDKLANDYWTGYLKSVGKKSLYKDTLINESYRLIYWGNYLAFVEIIKKADQYIIITDSIVWGSMKSYHSYDTLNNPVLINDIKEKSLELYAFKDTHEEFKEVMEFELIESTDDRDNWLIEFKIDDNYWVHSSIEVNSKLKELILLLMRAAKLEGFDLYTKNGNHEKY